MKHVFLFLVTGFIFAVTASSCSEKEETPVPVKTNPSLLSEEEGCDAGEDEDPLPMLAGTVKNTSNNPIARACVEVKTPGGLQIAITGTDSLGHYYFNSVINGNYNLIVTKLGYLPDTTAITVAGTAQTVNVTLQ